MPVTRKGTFIGQGKNLTYGMIQEVGEKDVLDNVHDKKVRL